jgi:hypothetical protein
MVSKPFHDLFEIIELILFVIMLFYIVSIVQHG